MIKQSLYATLLAATLLFSTITPTSAQTATPPPTPQAIVAAFKKAGLEAETPKAITSKDYGAAPRVCTGLRFLIPSLGEDAGGRAFVCKTTAERDSLAGYYNALSKQSDLLFSWVFVRGPVLVQINGSLPKAKALLYEKAIVPFGKSQPIAVATLSPLAAAKVKAGQAYTTAVMVKACVMLVEELATGVKAKSIDGLTTMAAFIAIAAIYSPTKAALQTPPPSMEFKPAWEQGNITTKKLDGVLGAWLDKEIDSTEVLKRLPAIQTDADLMVESVQDVAVAQFKLNRAELQQQYKEEIEKLRSGFKDAFK